MISVECHVLAKVPQGPLKVLVMDMKISESGSLSRDTKLYFALHISFTCNSASKERLGH